MAPYIPSVKQYKLKYDWPQALLTEDLEALFDDVFDPLFQQMADQVLNFTQLNDPETMPAELLDLYLMDVGFRLATDFPGILLDEREKRKLAILAVPIHRQKGTGPGIVNVIRLLLGIETRILNPYNIDVWQLGDSELGIDTVLFLGDDISSPVLYSFDIEILEEVTLEQTQKILAIVNYMKPIHTHLLQIVTPEEPPDHWELGISELGITTDLH